MRQKRHVTVRLPGSNEMIPVELLADWLATFLVKLMILIGALPAATQATASSLPNNQHHCKRKKDE